MSKKELIVLTLIGYAITGLISWFAMSKKEEHCLKECKRLSRTSQVWMPKLCFNTKFTELGACLWCLILILCFLVLTNGAWAAWIMLGVMTLTGAILYMILKKANKYPITYISYPLFALADDNLVVWEYIGFGKRKVHKLSELTRNEGEEIHKAGMVFTLYKEKEAILHIRLDAYKETKEITQMFEKIPVV